MGVEYCGTRYHGWQSQQSLLTIQGTVEEALSKLANQSIAVVCAGRTDAGVHAFEQVIHFDTTTAREQHEWLFGSNYYLPDDIRILWAKEVEASFHARFSATKRHYRYYLVNRPVHSAIYTHARGWCARPLDIGLMQQATNYLIGEHDFSAFRGADCQAKSPVRTLDALDIHRQDDQIIFNVSANAFLHHMVRNLVGSLIEVGMKKHSPEWIKAVLASKDRGKAGPMASAKGLYLLKVDY